MGGFSNAAIAKTPLRCVLRLPRAQGRLAGDHNEIRAPPLSTAGPRKSTIQEVDA